MADVTIAGHKVSKQTLYIAGGGTGLGLFLWYRHKQTASAASSSAAPAASTSTDPYPPDGTVGNPSDPYSTDPATGMTYGDEQAGGFAPGAYGGFGGGGYPGGTGLPPVTGLPGPGSFTSNAQWAQYAEQQLSFVDPNALSASLGKYLTGQQVTSDQAGMIDQAIAIAGYPPVAGPGGNPPGILQGPGGGGGGNVAVPNVVGANKSAASKAIVAAGLVPRLAPSDQFDPITKESPAAGTQVKKGSIVVITGSKKRK